MKYKMTKLLCQAALCCITVSCRPSNESGAIIVQREGSSDFKPCQSPGPPSSQHVRIASVIGPSGSGSAFVEWYISTNVLAMQPRWNGLTSATPLSPERACGLALTRIHDQFPQVSEWSVESILLLNLYKGGGEGRVFSYPDIWQYQITFMPTDPKVRSQLQRQPTGYAMTQVVLLDGTVVAPTVIRRE